MRRPGDSLSPVHLPALVEPVETLSPAERARSARNIALTGLGDLGQRRLAAAHVVVVGAGGLGSPAILALLAAGIGTLTVLDADVVELSNLQRQVIHRRADLGAPKVQSATRSGADLSPETVVIARQTRITPDNAIDLLRGADVVVDGTDDFTARSTVAQACELRGIPLVWGALEGHLAQVTVFWSAPPEGRGAVRLSDLYPPETVGEPPSCSAVGVLGAMCIQVGGLMAGEVIKLVTGMGESLLGRLLVIDGLRTTQREIPLRGSIAEATAHPIVVPAPVPEPIDIPEVTMEELLAAHRAGVTLLDVREPVERSRDDVAGALAIPLDELLASPGAVTGPVVVICSHGVRARRAALVLRSRGVDASVLAGGLSAWRRHG